MSDVYGSSTHVEQEKGCPYQALATPRLRQVLKKGLTCRQVSANDTCERTIPFRASILANGILLLPATWNHVAFSGSRKSRASKPLLPCWKNNNLPSFNILPVLLIQWTAFVQQSSSHQSPVPNIEHTRRCQAATTVREPFSLTVSILAKGSDQ